VNSRRQHRRRALQTAAFTLVELMVVMAIIVFALFLTLPSIIDLMTAGADMASFDLLAAQIDSARTRAVETGNFYGVHVQIADSTGPRNTNIEQQQYACIVSYTKEVGDETGTFSKAGGYRPIRIPGGWGFGEADRFRTAGVWDTIEDEELYDSGTNYGDFTTFTVVYDAAGQAVARPDDAPIEFDAGGVLFDGDERLWAAPPIKEGVLAITIFDLTRMFLLDADGRQDHLKRNGQYMLIHHQTGLVYPRRPQ